MFRNGYLQTPINKFFYVMIWAGISFLITGCAADSSQVLYNAINERELDTLKELLSEDQLLANTVFFDKFNSPTAVETAVIVNDENIVSLLLSKGANPLIENWVGLNALHMAAFHGKTKIAQILLDYGVDINVRSKQESKETFGATPLMYAALRDHSETVLFLIENGAEINLKDSYGKTALFYSLFRTSKGLESFDILLKNGAHACEVDKNGMNILDLAVKSNRLEEVQIILSNY